MLRANFLDHLFGTPEDLQRRLHAFAHYTVRACDEARKAGHVIFNAERDELVRCLAKAYVLLCKAGNLPIEVPEEMDQTAWLYFVQLVGYVEHGQPAPEWLNSVRLWLFWAPYMTAHPDGLLLELPVRLDSNRVVTVDPTDAGQEALPNLSNYDG